MASITFHKNWLLLKSDPSYNTEWVRVETDSPSTKNASETISKQNTKQKRFDFVDQMFDFGVTLSTFWKFRGYNLKVKW